MNSANGKVDKMDSEELLAQKLTKLEMGHSLEELLNDLPEQEARLLRLAAMLHEAPFPAEDAALVAEQRSKMLAAFEMGQSRQPAPIPEDVSNMGMVANFKQLAAWVGSAVDGLLQRREVAMGLGAALVVVLLTAGGWLFWMQQNRSASLAGQDEPAIVADPAGEDEAAPAVVDGGDQESVQTAVPNASADGSVGAASDPGNRLFLPLAESTWQLDAQTAVLQIDHGVAELQSADGHWQQLPRQTTLTAGQRIRTGQLSSATLTFFDGSQAMLGANSELSIDQLNAQRPEDGFRIVVLTQHVGESDHIVEFRNDGGSRYEVKTPAGSGLARGTQFQVVVTPGLLAQFVVTEGRVDVSGLNQVVPVVAGQTTAVLAGSPPQRPAFRISGEGQVNQTGSTWVIGGQTFQTNSQTIIVGNPQVGDLVWVEGRLLDDGSRQADRIVLLRQAAVNQFTLTGQVDEMTPTAWTVAGQMVLVNGQTRIEPGIVAGDTVEVSGVIAIGGVLQAERIEPLNSQAQPFQFAGLLESMGGDGWLISGVNIFLDDSTVRDDDVEVGDLVLVNGRILPNGVWLAESIREMDDDDEDDLPEFAFAGQVQSMAPWQVANISFETRIWTAQAPQIAVGDWVRVRGVILNDGNWVATSIDPLYPVGDDDDDDLIVLVGVVGSIDPWVVNGLPLVLTDDVAIQGNILAGDLVWVRIRLLPNGSWQVVTIRPLTPRFGIGCFNISTLVVGRQANQLQLQHWPMLTLDDDDFDDELDDIEIDNIVTFSICIGFDGTVLYAGPIIVIYQSVVVIAPPAPQPPVRGNSNNNGNGGGNNSNSNRNNNG